MRIAIAYPPLESEKGIPQVSQNRQFQWTIGGSLAYSIYPVIPASAATLLKNNGHEVLWADGVAEKISYKKWLKNIIDFNPDLIFLEVKTPVIKKYWQVINDLKKIGNIKCILGGDHITALPEESFQNSQVDYIFTGGNYDFLLLNLVRYLEKKEKTLEPGIWFRKRISNQKLAISNNGKFTANHSLDTLPIIDRGLTKWNLYAYKNSNFYRAPGAYTMFGRDCWWGKCTFCSWTTLFPGKNYRIVSVKHAIKEIENLVENYHVKEIMDDSGTFPVGNWLTEFCEEIIKRDYQKKIRINCNMRFNTNLTQKDYDLMGKAGFRFVLYGLESANQKTLDKINKNLKVSQIEKTLTMAKKAGLWPHITVMIGYPWECENDIKNTVAFVKNLFQKGLVDSMQATIVIPYPGTPLFEECKKNKWLKTTDWDRYDMREPIMKTKVSEEKLLSAVRELYSASIWNKTFILNTIKQLRKWDGIKYVTFQGFKYLGKLLEFRK